MKKIRINKMMQMLFVIALISFPAIVMAQPPDGGGDPGVPIDGGVTLLLAAGAAYGVRKYREGRSKGINN